MKVKTTIYLDTELKKRVRHYLADHEKNLSKWVSELMDRELVVSVLRQESPTAGPR